MFLGEAARTEDCYIPFVPYPINRKSGQPVPTQLKPMEHKSDIKYGAPMFDPVTGLHVPIMALTIHPKSGAVLPIGGTQVDPVTGLRMPIEIGSLTVDATTGQPVPILAVTLDTDTGTFTFHMCRIIDTLFHIRCFSLFMPYSMNLPPV